MKTNRGFVSIGNTSSTATRGVGWFTCFFLVAFILSNVPNLSSQAAESPQYNERDLIAVLQSDSPPAEKAITCKRLAVFGSEAAVPALAPLLTDPQLASWARIALEVIPGTAADTALREAMNKTHGLLLVGVINSIGVRRDAEAGPALAARLDDPDSQVASAAAVALGRIGNVEAAKILNAALAKAPAANRSSVAEGCIRCAEHLFADGKSSDAVKLYDSVRRSQAPKQKVLEATRGAILARKSGGVSLLVEQLRSPDKAFFQIGLTTARELPGTKATKAVEGELRRALPERQPALLLALAGRDDPGAMPAILNAAKAGSKQLRKTAVEVLDQLGKPASATALLAVAAEGDPDLTPAATAALARISGTELDHEVLVWLKHKRGNERRVAIELVGRRRIAAAVPELVACASDPEVATRRAAVQALGEVGGEPQIASLVQLLEKTSDSEGRASIETALLSISGRIGSACSHGLQPLAQSSEGALRIVALHALASAGGAEALTTVSKATADRDETVQDEAVRTLANWPNTWPEDAAVTEPLLAVAKSGTKTSHQVLASRGYLQFLEGDKQLSPAVKVAKVKLVLPLIQRPEEKQLAIAVMHGAPSDEGLEVLGAFAGEPGVTEEACAAIVDLAAKDNQGLSNQERQKVLQRVLEKSSNDTLKRKAEAALKTIQ